MRTRCPTMLLTACAALLLASVPAALAGAEDPGDGARGNPVRLPLAALFADEPPPPPQPVGPAAPRAFPVEPLGAGDSRVGRAAVKGGLGFTLGPTDFLLALEGSYFLTNDLAVGPLFQLGIDDDPFIFAPSLNARYLFDLRGLGRLRPLVEGGIGLVYECEDIGPRDRDETGFLFNFGGGFQYFLTDGVAVGSEVLFNFVPDEVLGDRFFFSWQVLAVSFFF
jgi:hypothetical protein